MRGGREGGEGGGHQSGCLHDEGRQLWRAALPLPRFPPGELQAMRLHRPARRQVGARHPRQAHSAFYSILRGVKRVANSTRDAEMRFCHILCSCVFVL